MPVQATAQRFSELNPSVKVRWHLRSLNEFGHGNVAELAERFDLIVLDHPWMGFAAANQILIPLDSLADAASLSAWRNTVGGSFDSYVWGGSLLAAPIDAASPAAAIQDEGFGIPEAPTTWEEVLDWARRGRVVAPCFPPDLFLHLLMLLATAQVPLFANEGYFGPESEVLTAMDQLRELVDLLPSACADMNPIRIYEVLAKGGEATYCPFAYSYSNYARAGYGRHRLRFVDLPSHPSGTAMRGVLGGTGLAVSAKCQAVEEAYEYVRFTASTSIQTGLYAFAGGQPASRAAWQDQEFDRHCNAFCSSTGPTIERAWTRPRYFGYPMFQEVAGVPLLSWMQGAGSASGCLGEMNRLYRRSLTRGRE